MRPRVSFMHYWVERFQLRWEEGLGVVEFPVTDSLIFLKFGIDLGFGSSRGSFGYSFIHWITDRWWKSQCTISWLHLHLTFLIEKFLIFIHHLIPKAKTSLSLSLKLFFFVKKKNIIMYYMFKKLFWPICGLNTLIQWKNFILIELNKKKNLIGWINKFIMNIPCILTAYIRF